VEISSDQAILCVLPLTACPSVNEKDKKCLANLQKRMAFIIQCRSLAKHLKYQGELQHKWAATVSLAKNKAEIKQGGTYTIPIDM
jgi:hypothetical protein